MCTALAPIIGYDAAGRIAKEAWASGRTVRQVVVEKGLLPVKELDRLLDPSRLTRPGLPGKKGRGRRQGPGIRGKP
jgi:fumarate hydratase class II